MGWTHTISCLIDDEEYYTGESFIAAFMKFLKANREGCGCVKWEYRQLTHPREKRECGKEVGAEEVDSPGTPEQQKEPRAKLAENEKKHLNVRGAIIDTCPHCGIYCTGKTAFCTPPYDK